MITRVFRGGSIRFFSAEVQALTSEQSGEISHGKKLKKIGKALETYLRQSREHVAMMNRERADFELGKRHLANMMSLDPNTLTQQDIDEAIQYLFPSGLSDPRARPVMRPPDEILPRFHRFTFDDEAAVNRFYAERVFSSKKTDADKRQVNISGTQWLSEERMKKKLGEKFSTEMYTQLVMAFDHLASLPASSIESDFINEYRMPLASSTDSKLFGPRIPEIQLEAETKRRIAHVRTHCKATTAEVTVTDSGLGKFDINGQSLHEFRHLIAREILLAPMIISKLLGKVDVKATSTGAGGATALPRAVRHGTALCIAALYPETMEPLRLAGLLTLDPRKKERSKVNQPGARSKWIWKRR